MQNKAFGLAHCNTNKNLNYWAHQRLKHEDLKCKKNREPCEKEKLHNENTDGLC